jgi:hypothetical protein
MFQSFKFIRYLGEKDNKHTWKYEITDSEFGTVYGVAAGCGIFGIEIIEEYSKRGSNVAVNLAVAFVWWQKQYPWYSVQELMNGNKKNNLLFQQYEEDLQKYLVLL